MTLSSPALSSSAPSQKTWLTTRFTRMALAAAIAIGSVGTVAMVAYAQISGAQKKAVAQAMANPRLSDNACVRPASASAPEGVTTLAFKPHNGCEFPK